MRVLVCGGKEYRNPVKVREALDRLRKGVPCISLLIHGAAPGADSLAGAWAENVGVDQVTFPANWRGRGRAAGPYRNQLMLELILPNLVVAFPGGSGTSDMVRRARAAGVDVIEITEETYGT